jgi:hypothetical protein
MQNSVNWYAKGYMNGQSATEQVKHTKRLAAFEILIVRNNQSQSIKL